MKLDQNRIESEISSESKINILEVEKAIRLHYKGIANIIREDKPSSIAIPFFGTIHMNSKSVKEYESNNS